MPLKQHQVEPQDWIDTGDRSGDGSDLALHLGARRLALNEVGAAIAHQIVEPLTSLLLYMHEMKRVADASGPESNPERRIVDDALRETERVCAIMERIGNSFDGPQDSDLAVARGRDAIRWLSRTNAEGLPPGWSHPRFSSLSARERQVLELISGGSSNKAGALTLKISPRTFEAHRAQIMRKLGARNAADLIRMTLTQS